MEVGRENVAEMPSSTQHAADVEVPSQELIVGIRCRQVPDHMPHVVRDAGPSRLKRRAGVYRDSHGDRLVDGQYRFAGAQASSIRPWSPTINP